MTDSVAEHGLIQPLVVREADEGYELIDGERRYRACAQAAVTEAPVVVRETDTDTEGLDVALVANMSRVDLDPVQEARAMARLIDSGLTRKGVAEKLSLPQARVRERLGLLALGEDLLPKVADATIPLAPVKALVELAKIHPELPVRAVAQVLEREASEDPYGEQWTWKDVQHNALEVATANEDQLPAGVYLAYRSYPLECFMLSEKAQGDLEKLAKLRGVAVQEISTLRFEAAELEQARALGAAHELGRGMGALIAGQDIADLLASDAITAALKQERARRREQKRTAEQNGTDPADAGGEPAEPVDEQAAKEQRRRQREAEQQARREAVAYNAELGAACVKQLARIKVDERVVRILSALDLGSELD
ncbi:MAG: ParB/RepB/Spo0J family partition protein, partial [Pseudonocardiaceae bacterium]